MQFPRPSQPRRSPKLALSALALAAAAFAVASAPLAEAEGEVKATAASLGPHQQVTPSIGCSDWIRMNPVVMRTSAGATLLGPTMSSIAIYSNGLVVMSEATGTGGASAAGQTYIDPLLVAELSRDIQALGAFRQCDETQQVYDVPLTTMTVFGRGPDALAHSYSYWIGTEDQRAIDAMVRDFILLRVLD